MTPKEKAKELVRKFNFEHLGGRFILYQTVEESKRCALIAVDEILNNFGTLTEGMQHYAAYSTIKFYEEVKHEINNL